jgi:subtilisin family serine protease
MKPAPKQLIHDNGDPMTLDPTRLVIGLREEREAKQLEAELQNAGLVLEDASQEEAASGIPLRVNNAPKRFWVRSRDGAPIKQSDIDRLNSEWVGPVYRLHRTRGLEGLLCILPTALVIKAAQDKAALQRLARHGLKEIPEKSKYLGDFRYFTVSDPKQKDALEIRDELVAEEKDAAREVHFETIPLIVPTAMIPNDTLFPLQWNMTQVRAGGPGLTGWDYSTGNAGVVVCILDEGCDLNHPDLQFAGQGINLGTMMPPGSPTGNHGTACAGIAAASINNGGTGVAGMAGSCRLLPAAFVAWSDVEVAAGINWATAQGVRVISMSFGWNAWSHAIIDPAIQNAFNSNVVMCVATHNDNGPIRYPATNPLVIAVGASDQADDRKSPASPDGECWGSNFGPQISVVAPGVRCPSTDRQGAMGYNDNNGGPKNLACANYPTCGDPAGNYIFIFNGTSAATPHVAGLAALLISYNNALTNVQVRNIIEQYADKVGTSPYAVTPGKPNGTWNQNMGYGRINVYRAVHSLAKNHFKEIKEAIDKYRYIEHEGRPVEGERAGR